MWPTGKDLAYKYEHQGCVWMEGFGFEGDSRDWISIDCKLETLKFTTIDQKITKNEG